MGLDDHQLEGLEYRFVPVKTKSIDGQTGIVATDEMYNNLINKFNGEIWETQRILDETNMRMTMNSAILVRLYDAL